MSLSTKTPEGFSKFEKAANAADLNAEQYLTGETAEIRQSPFQKMTELIAKAAKKALGA